MGTSCKPHSPSGGRNREPILAVLRDRLADRSNVPEIGCGTGPHAVFFAAGLPHPIWQASDRRENLARIGAPAISRPWMPGRPISTSSSQEHMP